MGYEVLDTDGADVDVPRTPFPTREVVAIDDLVVPRAAPSTDRRTDGRTDRRSPAPSSSRSWPTSWRVPSSWLPSSSLPSWLPRDPRAHVAVVAAVALVLGIVGGGLWTRHLQTQQRASARLGELSAMAMVTSVDAVGGDRPYADITVRVVNAGPLPLTVVTSPQNAQPSLSQPVVHDLGGAMRVPADDSLSVSVRLLVDCTGRVREPRRVWVPVRTADGQVHALTASQDALSESLHFGQAPCSDPPGETLVAQISGSISAPELRLRNDGNRELEVRLDVAHSPFVAQTTNFSVLRLTPSLPQVVPPHSSVYLKVLLTPWSCPRGLEAVQSSQLTPYVVLRVGSPGADVLAQEVVGVDLSTLWGAALARDCS
ncbi:hypothetical protein GCM10027446_18600 [Angustibacter peucedani]